ncbi:MAG TPA: hypothetical protein VHR85_07750 [Nocardioides sp.]|jgi:hypothetical protein|nr:hypothetical protein [Nocardioides sp.]
MGVPRFLIGSLAGALAAPIVLLAACGGDDASIADPPVSPHPTSSSPTGTPPHESPEAFIRRWAEAEKRMENTGQVEAYLALSKGCTACRNLTEQVSRYYAAGGFVKWGGWQILSIKVNSRHNDATTYAVKNRSLPTTYQTSRDGRIRHFSGGVTTELLDLEPSGGTWNLSSKAELAS